MIQRWTTATIEPSDAGGFVAYGDYLELKKVACAMRDWIDSVPQDIQLPVMPGFDRDWADEIIDA